MAQRIAYEQKMLCGKWIEQQADFASVLQGVDFCADMNAKTGAYRYRVKVVSDTDTVQEGTADSQHSELIERLEGIIKTAATLEFIAEQVKAAMREAASEAASGT